jgi:hypothetical protein
LPLPELRVSLPPCYGDSNPYLGNTAYTGNPTTDALVSMLPILLGPH